MNVQSTHDLALNLRRDDYDHFLAAQLAPVGKRHALYAIAAFHAELTHIRHVVREPLIGHIRLAWWREGVDELLAGKTPRGHPVMQALSEILTANSTIAPLLYQAIEAHAADFDDDVAIDEHYYEHTTGALHLAWALVLDEAAARANEQVILCAASAYVQSKTPGKTNLPRSLKPLRAMAALANLRAHGRYGKLARVWQVVKLYIK